MGLDDISSAWQDVIKFLPYRDHKGVWQLLPWHTQARVRHGKIEYRERDETEDEYCARQW
jgi:hypothetical protein